MTCYPNPADPDLVRGRKYSGEDLALLLLSLLIDGDRHGYALRRALHARSQGYYAPSPGMLYPALALLESRGWASVHIEGARKSYSATAAGRAHLAHVESQVALLWAGLDHAARKTAWLRRAWVGQSPGQGPQGEDPATGWLPEFVAARVALKKALLLRSHASVEHQRQLARVLQQAVADIEAACPLPSPYSDSEHA